MTTVERGTRVFEPRSHRSAGLFAAFAAALLLAGCNSLFTAGSPPDAAVVGVAVNKASDSSSNKAGSEEHARIVAAYGGIYHDAKARADDRPDRRPGGGVVGRARAGLSHHHSQCARGQRLRASGRLSLRHPRAAWRSPTIRPRSPRCSPTRWAISPPTMPSSAQNKARNALIVSRVVTDVLDDELRQAGARLEPAHARQLLAPAGARGRRHRHEDHRQGGL